MTRTATERRLRRIAERRLEPGEEFDMWCRVWYSRPARLAAFAARFRDFAVLTDRRLLMFEAGWFTRVPRRRVLADRLDELVVITGAARPVRTVRVEHPNHKPLVLDFGRKPDEQRVADSLLARTVENAAAKSAP